MLEYVSFIGLLLLLFYREYATGKERADLLDRLMSRNFQDFKNMTETPEENDFGEEDLNLLNIEEARDDIMSPGA